jgi:4-amino-4-deoxy-L-arabinose transferase-like glycosyltransferase
LFLFLGHSNFHTRGEPREALVAFAMLEDGNWTLPITNGTDIAYKPPLFHWAIASLSSIISEVNEYTSRMPSAIALMVMILAGFAFYAKRRGKELAFLTSLITLTNFEVHRAGVACRVDMLLSALMVLALYALYQWTERKMKGIPWWGILCLSGAFLTKGPVGVVLPCAVVAAFAWIRNMGFLRICINYIGVVLAACILPALWYIAAWKVGGDQFLTLVIEENVLRFLGKMTYASHENPWPYNVMTVVTGFVPYTILLIMSLFTLKYTRISSKPKEWWSKFVTYIKQMDDTRLFSLLSIVIMFVFYCIPKSKRSVYLLPIYPFIAYFIAEYIVYLVKNKPKSVRWYNTTLCVLGLILTTVFIIVKCGLVPHTLFQGKHAAENLAYLNALETLPLSPANLMIILAPLVAAILYLKWPAKIHPNPQKSLALFGSTMAFALFFALDGVYQPAVLNVKSNKPIAERVQALAPEGNIYSYITLTAEGNRLHPFTLNYYLGNRVVPFIDFAPTEGYLFLGDKEYDGFMEKYGKTFNIEQLPDSRFKSNDNRDWMNIYHFKKIE